MPASKTNGHANVEHVLQRWSKGRRFEQSYQKKPWSVRLGTKAANDLGESVRGLDKRISEMKSRMEGGAKVGSPILCCLLYSG